MRKSFTHEKYNQNQTEQTTTKTQQNAEYRKLYSSHYSDYSALGKL